MSKLDLPAALRNLIAAQVEAALEPHRALLNSLADLAREGQVPGLLAPRAGRRNVARKSGRNTVAASVVANDFAVGQLVSYRQGRGTFEAQIVAIDAEQGELALERVSDGKRVARPFGKVMLAG